MDQPARDSGAVVLVDVAERIGTITLNRPEAAQRARAARSRTGCGTRSGSSAATRGSTR